MNTFTSIAAAFAVLALAAGCQADPTDQTLAAVGKPAPEPPDGCSVKYADK